MIANRLLGSAKQLNYKYIIGELLLIFTGISLSLYFDDWRERRSDDQKLKETLNLIIAICYLRTIQTFFRICSEFGGYDCQKSTGTKPL